MLEGLLGIRHATFCVYAPVLATSARPVHDQRLAPSQTPLEDVAENREFHRLANKNLFGALERALHDGALEGLLAGPLAEVARVWGRAWGAEVWS